MKRATGIQPRNLGRTLSRTVLAAWLCLFALPVLAGDPPDDCFCLAHTSGAVLRGCFAYKAKTDFYATATCTDPETGQKSEQMMTQEWRHIPSGEDRCKPCRTIPRETAPEPPRGSDQSGASTSPTAKPTGPESTK